MSILTLSDYSGSRNQHDSMATGYDETRSERLERYQLLWAYYKNTMYDSDQLAAISGAAAKRANEVLYKWIKPLFNVCNQAVTTDVGAILAPPVRVVSENADREQTIVDIWQRSKFQLALNRLIRFGAVYGDAYLRLYDEVDAPKIMVHPPTEMDISVDPHSPDTILSAILSYNFFQGDKRRDYRMVITPDLYATYLDDELFAYDEGDAVWPNSLGFVPVVPLRLLDFGEVYGEPTFHNVLSQLDATNEIASQMAEVVRRNADPQLVAYGMRESDLSKGSDAKGKQTVWWVKVAAAMGFTPRLEFLEWSGNVDGVIRFLDWCKDSIQEDLPEMHLKRIREQGAPSGYSVRLQLTELLLKLGEMRHNAVEALRQINAMALVAAGKADDLEEAQSDHEITTGEFLPPDLRSEADLVYSDLENEIIDIEEAQKRRHLDEDDARKIRRRIENKKEANAAKFMAFNPNNDDDGQNQDADEEDEA